MKQIARVVIYVKVLYTKGTVVLWKKTIIYFWLQDCLFTVYLFLFFPFNRMHQGTVGNTSQSSHLLPVWKAQDTGAVTAAIPQQEGLILILKKWCLRSGEALIIQYFHLSLAIQISIAVPVQATTAVGQVWKRPYDRTPSQAFKNWFCLFIFSGNRHVKETCLTICGFCCLR